MQNPLILLMIIYLIKNLKSFSKFYKEIDQIGMKNSSNKKLLEIASLFILIGTISAISYYIDLNGAIDAKNIFFFILVAPYF